MPPITLTLPSPHAAQKTILREAKRYNVVACGRRWGKSTLGVNLLVDPALYGKPVGWFAPSYKYLLEAWDWTLDIVAPIISSKNATHRRIKLLTGGTLEFWTLDDEDAGRSRKYARVCIDEAGLVGNLNELWQAAIQPTLMDMHGDAWFFGTPKGMNFFYHAYIHGQDPLKPNWASWQMPTSSNPYIDPAEIEEKRHTTPERLFEQEYLAIFHADAGGVFRHIMDCATVLQPEPWLYNHKYVIGVDLARKADFTAIIVIDTSVYPKRVVYMDRFNQIDWHIQVNRIKAVAERYQTRDIIVDQTGVGDPIVQQLQREVSPSVVGFQFTNATKAEIVERLALAFEKQEIAILKDDTLIQELRAYEQERLPSGLIRYSAPENLHDDCVSSLCMAWYLADNSGGFSYRYDKR
jgi:phage FluMu gp28-like protein